MAAPQGLQKKQSRLARQKQDSSDRVQTAQLDSVTTTTEIVELGIVAQKVSVAAPSAMTATAAFSMDGVNYSAPQALSTTPITYSTSLVTSVKIVCSVGTGKATIVAV
jgi:hypothetical protein